MAEEAGAESGSGDSELNLGHQGVGDNCMEKVVNYSGKFFLAGGVIGAAEGCFLTPIKGSKTPLIFRCLGVMLERSILLGAAGGVYAAGICAAARLRDKDDFVNASIGGALAGSVFGFKYRKVSVGLLVSGSLALGLGITKYRHNTYLPEPFPLPRDGWRGPPPIYDEQGKRIQS